MTLKWRVQGWSEMVSIVYNRPPQKSYLSKYEKESRVTQEYIELRGGRENNLKNVSLRIPKRKITIFTGVSGSGKSSIVFDTIATEAQRLLNENFSFFVRNFLPRFAQPDADAIENLSMAIVVDQKRLGGGSHSTMGTITDIYSVLRLLYSRVGQPFVGYSNVFSFNDPQGRFNYGRFVGGI